MDPSAFRSLIVYSFNYPQQNIYNSFQGYPEFITKYKDFNANSIILQEFNTSRKIIQSQIIDNVLTDPMKNYLGNFPHRNSILLADIDSYWSVTGPYLGYIIKQDIKEWTWATVNDDTIGFARYLQYRLPNSYGYMMKSNNTCSINNTQQNLDWTRTTVYNTNNSIDFIDEISEIAPMGVDVLVIDIKDNSLEQILSALLLSLSMVKKEKSVVWKIKQLDNKLLQDALYILSQNYGSLSITKPLAENLTNHVHIIIAQGKHQNTIKTMKKIRQLYQEIDYNTNNKRLLTNTPKEFNVWVDGYMLQIQNYRQNILELVEQGETDIYDPFKAWAIWNLP